MIRFLIISIIVSLFFNFTFNYFYPDQSNILKDYKNKLFTKNDIINLSIFSKKERYTLSVLGIKEGTKIGKNNSSKIKELLKTEKGRKTIRKIVDKYNNIDIENISNTKNIKDIQNIGQYLIK